MLSANPSLPGLSPAHPLLPSPGFLELEARTHPRLMEDKFLLSAKSRFPDTAGWEFRDIPVRTGKMLQLFTFQACGVKSNVCIPGRN